LDSRQGITPGMDGKAKKKNFFLASIANISETASFVKYRTSQFVLEIPSATVECTK